MKLQNSLASLQTRASDSGLAFWGEGSEERGDDDISRRAVLLVFSSTFVMSDHLIYSHQLYSGLCELDIGLCEGFRRKLEIGWGEACFLRGI